MANVMKRINGIIVFILLICSVLFSSCGSGNSTSVPLEELPQESEESPYSESTQETANDELMEREEVASTEVVEESSEEEEESETSTEEATEEENEDEAVIELEYEEPTWDTDYVGGIYFDAPVSWDSSRNSHSVKYSLLNSEGNPTGYIMSAAFNEYDNSNIDYYLKKDTEQYDISHEEELEIEGCPAVYIMYETSKDGQEEAHVTFYIQVYPESGLAVLSYTAPLSDPELYLDDFYHVIDTVSLRDDPDRKIENEENTAGEDNYSYDNQSGANNSYTAGTHSGYEDSSVTVPDKEETEGHLVWVPTKGGKKYHSNPGCSGMEDPMQVTIETAEANGYTPCKRCY